MQKSNGKDIRHSNALQSSDPDTIQVSDAVEYRVKEVGSTYFREKGMELFIPKHLDKDMFLWRTMAVRHSAGDYRHTEDEKKSLKNVAEWTLEENCKLKGQEYVPLDWGDG